MNTAHTIDLLSFDSIERVRKLATEPISIEIARAIANQEGFPSSNRSMRCRVEIIEERIGTSIKKDTITLFRSLFSIVVLNFSYLVADVASIFLIS